MAYLRRSKPAILKQVHNYESCIADQSYTTFASLAVVRIILVEVNFTRKRYKDHQILGCNGLP